MSKIFTNQKKPLLPDSFTSKKTRCVALTILAGLLAFFCPIYSYLMLEYLHFGGKRLVFNFLGNGTARIILGLAFFYIVYLCLTLLVKKLWVSSLITTLISAVIGLVDHIKFASTGDYFYPWDIQQTGNLSELFKFIKLDLTAADIILVVFSFSFAVLFFFLQTELPLKLCIRLSAFALIAVSLLVYTSVPKRVIKLFNRAGIYIEDTVLQTSNYQANGFTCGFAVNLLSAEVDEPDGYGKDTVKKIMSGYKYQGVDDKFLYPDVVVILSESFWDVRKLGGTFSEDPLEGFDALTAKDGVYSGNMYQTGFGGGTVRPEFEVLTGLSTDGLPGGSVPWRYITSPTETYASVLRDIGYRTMSIHPYLSRFYDRKRAYPLAGIDETYFEEDLKQIDNVNYDLVSVYDYVSDDSFVSYIEYFLEDGDDSTPKFIYGISMENHQSYYGKYQDCEIVYENDRLDDEMINTVANYANGVMHADRALSRLADYINNRERPTVFVVFGDHLPSLGSNYKAYRQAGLFGSSGESSFTPDEHDIMQSTPFFVLTNFQTEETDILKKGSENKLASYNLLAAVYELINAPRTPLSEFLADYYTTIPYYNVRLGITLTDDQKYYASSHKILTYDRLKGGRYSLD